MQRAHHSPERLSNCFPFRTPSRASYGDSRLETFVDHFQSIAVLSSPPSVFEIIVGGLPSIARPPDASSCCLSDVSPTRLFPLEGFHSESVGLEMAGTPTNHEYLLHCDGNVTPQVRAVVEGLRQPLSGQACFPAVLHPHQKGLPPFLAYHGLNIFVVEEQGFTIRVISLSSQTWPMNLEAPIHQSQFPEISLRVQGHQAPMASRTVQIHKLRPYCAEKPSSLCPALP